MSHSHGYSDADGQDSDDGREGLHGIKFLIQGVTLHCVCIASGPIWILLLDAVTPWVLLGTICYADTAVPSKSPSEFDLQYISAWSGGTLQEDIIAPCS